MIIVNVWLVNKLCEWFRASCRKQEVLGAQVALQVEQEVHELNGG